MPESEEEIHDIFPSKSKTLEKDEFAMDFDIDLENSWPLDHISEQPISPIWTFSDVEDEKHVSISASGNTNTLTSNPVQNPQDYCLIKERMTKALRYFKELTEQNILAQIWAPVKIENRYKLTTSGQPFVLDPKSNGLYQYRTVSLMYMFSLDGENDEILGLIGRVYQQKLPEWSPNVQYYSSKEYSRKDHALHYNVRGTLALPVFESLGGQSCVAVLELIMTSQKINYAPEVDKVCKALQAVNLRSSEIFEHPYSQICNEDRQNALSEILEILTIVCETHNLPLAQTWVPCRRRSVLANGGGHKKICSSFDGYCKEQICMSITEVAFYIIDSHTWGFHEACVEHHLQQGQGVAGRAFLSHNMCFCGNITEFCKTDYPLVHYALMFGLSSCFSICLQSSFTGNDDYVLEFFLPPNIIDFYEQKSLLGSILATMKEHFHSLKISSGLEIEEDCLVEIVEIIDGIVHLRLESVPVIQSAKLSARHDPSKEQIMINVDEINDRGNLGDNVGGSIDKMSCLEGKIDKKPSDRKRRKAEKSISLEVLQHHFSGSLKDAAKSLGALHSHAFSGFDRSILIELSRFLNCKTDKVKVNLDRLVKIGRSRSAECSTTLNGDCTGSRSPYEKVGTHTYYSLIYSYNTVCPTTMKRICRAHGISRWPSRKINKVNRSLSKLKFVIESVHGVEGAFGLDSPCTTSLPIAVDSPSSSKFQHQASLSTRPSKTKMNENDLNVVNEKGESTEKVVEGSVNPNKRDSCHDGPLIENSAAKEVHKIVSKMEQCFVLREPMESTMQYPMPNVEGILIEGGDSSKDLKNLCPLEDCRIKDLTPMQKMDTQKEMKSVTIKATYRDHMIRFRVSLNCCIVELKEEIAKRLKLDVGTFDIKYLDDDQEWILVACDADLQECMDILRSSGSNIIRLVVHDIVSILGSSVESSAE